MVSVYNVLCMLCGRSSGQLRNGTFYQASDAARPVREQGRNMCGFCSGNLFLEPDDSGVMPYSIADAVTAQRSAQARKAS